VINNDGEMTKRENDNRKIRLERYEKELKELYRKVSRKLDQISRITGENDKPIRRIISKEREKR